MDPLAEATAGVISASLEDTAAAYRVDSWALGRLAAFGQANPDLAGMMADAVVSHLHRLRPGHPARNALQTSNARELYDRLAQRLLGGRLDDEIVSRLQARMSGPMLDGTPPTLVFHYVTIIPPMVERRSLDLG
jgi:hypothetical protein